MTATMPLQQSLPGRPDPGPKVPGAKVPAFLNDVEGTMTCMALHLHLLYTMIDSLPWIIRGRMEHIVNL